MTNMPYEERIKNRDNDWYYNKCIRQYHFIIKSEVANQRYKEEIKQLRQNNLSMQEEMCLRWNELDNLQNEIFDLKDTIQDKNDCIGAYECIIEDRDKRIDKAIDYIDDLKQLKKVDYLKSVEMKYIDKLLDILKGDE